MQDHVFRHNQISFGSKAQGFLLHPYKMPVHNPRQVVCAIHLSLWGTEFQ